MNDLTNRDEAVDLLQSLGLKQYEAKCFVALSRIDSGTAKQISDLSDVPRTRVYDAVRVLESKGLVEIQHSNPKLFRAVSIEEAAATLRAEYEDRVDELEDVLRDVSPADTDNEPNAPHEVWALTGADAIQNRTHQLVTDADDEVVFVVSTDDPLTSDLVDALRDATDRGVSVTVGAADEGLREAVADRLPEADVFVSELAWLRGSDGDVAISRLLLVDGTTILVGSTTGGDGDEHAVFGRGFANGLVAIVRRLMSTGLFSGA